MGAITYQWQANNINVGTGNSYTLTSNEIGKTITAIASYTDGLGKTESVSSAATAIVAKNFTDLVIYGDVGGSNADTLTGMGGNDSLYGLTMNDDLSGQEGNDNLYGGYGQDSLYGGAGKDNLYGEQDNDYLDGGAGNDILGGAAGRDSLFGGLGIDVLNGGAGNDTLEGGAGKDKLTGGVGKDSFLFDTALKAGVDKITDFKPKDDTLILENAIFTQLITTGVLNADNFVKAATATDLNDYLIYNPGTGTLVYDADGAGQVLGVQIALLGVNLALTHADFVII